MRRANIPSTRVARSEPRIARAVPSRARPVVDGNAPRDARATSATRARAADRDEIVFARRARALERANGRGRRRTATKSVVAALDAFPERLTDY